MTNKRDANLCRAAQVLSGVLAEPQERSNEVALVQSWLWGTIISKLEELYPKGSSEVWKSPDRFVHLGWSWPYQLSASLVQTDATFGMCSCTNCTGEKIRGLGSLDLSKERRSRALAANESSGPAGHRIKMIHSVITKRDWITRISLKWQMFKYQGSSCNQHGSGLEKTSVRR